MSIIIDTTTKSLIAKMAGAPATTQPDFTISYASKAAVSIGGALNGLNAHGTLNGTSEVTLVSAPAASTTHNVSEATIYNSDTATVVITIQEADGATRRTRTKIALPVNYTLHYERDRGWYVTDTNGNNMAAGVTLLPAANGGTGVANGASSTLTLANAAFSLLGGGASSSLTLPNAATTITGGGTIALGGFTVTIPATDTVAMLGVANTFTQTQSVSVASTGGYVATSSSTTASQRGNIRWNRINGTGAIANGWYVGTFDFFGHDGTSYFGAANIACIADNTVSPGVVPLSMSFYTGSNNSPSLALRISSSQNIGLATSTFGTSATNTFAVATGTAPSTSPADAFQMYSADITAGNAAAHFRTEGGAVIKLFQSTALTTQLTSITHTSPGTPDYAIQNVTLAGYGFATADEGNTVLSVILNLQTRVAELETKLKANGFLT